MSIDIVTHCYAKEMKHYSVLLRYQLESIIKHPPKIPVVVRVCHVEDDTNTAAVVVDYQKRISGSFGLISQIMSRKLMVCRSPGRELAARGTAASLVWFADADYSFGKGCLDRVWEIYQESKCMVNPPTMLFPKVCYISRTWGIGDQQIARAASGVIPEFDQEEFSRHTHFYPIGGIFIVPGNFAREHGYPSKSRYHSPWRRKHPPCSIMRDDTKYRNFVKSKGPLFRFRDSINLYRIRHSTCGYSTIVRGPDEIPVQVQRAHPSMD